MAFLSAALRDEHGRMGGLDWAIEHRRGDVRIQAALPRLAMRGRETARLSQHSGRVAPGHSLRRGKQAPTHIYYLCGDLQWPVPVMWPSGTCSEK